MQLRGSRQVTTGLLVNEKVNIRPEYYRTARAMCQELFSTGSYFRMVPAALLGGTPGHTPTKVTIAKLDPLEGILAHIHHVKDSTDRRRSVEKKSDPTSARRLYSRFLFYKNFVALQAPLILPEGKTDVIYLRAAIRNLPVYHPQLGQFVGGKFVSAVRFMNYSHTIHDILQLGGGTGDLKHLIGKYRRMARGFGHAPLAHPVILIIDNDDGAKAVFSVAKDCGGPTISHSSADPFYHLGANLYIVKTPEAPVGNKSCIEDLFDPALLKAIIDGKSFDPTKEHGADGKYGKLVFAEKVVKPNADTIDFSKFALLLDRVVAVLNHHKAGAAMSVAV